MTDKPRRSWIRWVAAGTVTVVVGAVGIFIAAQLPIAPPTVITGFVIVIVGVVLGLLVAIRRSGSAPDEAGQPVSVTRRIRRAFYGSRSADSDRLGTALRASGTVGVGILGPTPGPFDNPPEEEAELDPEHLPWELRDASESDRTRS
jgi:hypothetical protein